MKIVYIDPLELTHTSIKEMFKPRKVSVFTKLSDFVITFDLETVQERRVVIMDIPVNIDKNIMHVKELIFLRALSDGNLKIILFSDFNKIRYGFNKVHISPDLTIDKKTKLDEVRSEIDKTFTAESYKPYSDSKDSSRNPTLTYSEYLYVMELMRGKTVKGISKTSNKGTKVLYAHQGNILRKYKLKNITALHSALTYE